MPSYQPGIPTGIVPLDEDYKNLQDNFTVLDTVYKKDHVALTDTSLNAGHHTVVHLVANSTAASNPPNNYPITPVVAVRRRVVRSQ